MRMVSVREEEVFISTICGKGDCCYTKTRETSSETVESSERSRVTPGFTINNRMNQHEYSMWSIQVHCVLRNETLTLLPKDRSLGCLQMQQTS